jgi:nitrate reductase cytochrome c-type subunit
MGTSPGRLAPCPATSAHFTSFVCRPGWSREEEVQSPARPSEAWNPTPPARSPALPMHLLREKMLPIPVSAASTEHLACHDRAARAVEAFGILNALHLNNFRTRLSSASGARRVGITTECHPRQGDTHTRPQSENPQFTRLERVSPRG